MSRVLSASATLWTLQVLLALFFAFGSGAPKLLLPTESLPMPIPLPNWFVYFIGAAEVLGALGLVLPAIVRRALPGSAAADARLTAAAATGLVLLTVCATAYQLLAHQPANAAFAAVMCALCAVIAVARNPRRYQTRRMLRETSRAGA